MTDDGSPASDNGNDDAQKSTGSPPEADRLKSSVDAAMHEFDYVASLIPLYRKLQLQIVAFAFVAYGAFIGLLGGSKDGTPIAVVNTVAALGPWLAFALLSAFLTAESRIVRASQYIEKTLYPKVDGLLGVQVLGFERAPSRYLKRYQRVLFPNSIPLVLILALPALVAGILYVALPATERDVVPAEWTYGGMFALVLVALALIRMTWSHESRGVRKLHIEHGKASWARQESTEMSIACEWSGWSATDLVVQIESARLRPLSQRGSVGASRIDPMKPTAPNPASKFRKKSERRWDFVLKVVFVAQPRFRENESHWAVVNLMSANGRQFRKLVHVQPEKAPTG
jgi:hypothetical protein